MDVETETSRDWAKDVDTETPSRLSLISVLYLDYSRLESFDLKILDLEKGHIDLFLGFQNKQLFRSKVTVRDTQEFTDQ